MHANPDYLSFSTINAAKTGFCRVKFRKLFFTNEGLDKGAGYVVGSQAKTQNSKKGKERANGTSRGGTRMYVDGESDSDLEEIPTLQCQLSVKVRSCLASYYWRLILARHLLLYFVIPQEKRGSSVVKWFSQRELCQPSSIHKQIVWRVV